MSAPWLAIDTATAWGTVAVGWGEEVEGERTVRLGTRNAAALLPQIDGLLRDVGRALDDLGGVVVGGGPGSFTGVRVAAATAKALAYVRGWPLQAFPTFLVVAAGSGRWGDPLGIVWEAYGGAVYGAAVRLAAREIEVLSEPVAAPLTDLLARWRGLPLAGVLGEAARRYRAQIEEELGVPVPRGPVHVPRASALLALAAAYPELGTPPDAAAWEPLYVHRHEPTWA